MKKKWKEYSPKADSWDKIQKMRDFDTQLTQNLKKLQEHSPRDLAWSGIQQKLEKKEKALNWKPFLVAASLTGLFLLAFYLIQQGTGIMSTEQPTELVANDFTEDSEKSETESTKPVNAPEVFSPVPLGTTEVKASPERVPEIIPELKIKRQLEFEKSIAVQGIDLQPRGKFVPPAEVPDETYHTVAVSWGLKEKTKLRIGSGADEAFDRQNTARAQEKTKPTTKPLTIIIK
ncbi:hypothetical protein [Algoriphagus namhaensis]